MQNDTPESRRRFLFQATSSIGLALSAPVIASLVASCETDEKPVAPNGKTYTFDVTTDPALAEVGGITAVQIDDLNNGSYVFIARVAAESFAVFSTTCTHAGNEVNLPEPGGNLVCPNHGAEFSWRDGTVLRQPTTGSATNLPRFASTFDTATNILTITG
jgi:cytochrome b6-f complex iron-sulfur subunit